MSALVDDAGPLDPAPTEAAPVGAPVAAAGTESLQGAPTASPPELRRDFGAHVESHYRRLVAQLYAITLDSAEAHDVVQDAYSRAWRSWSTIGHSPDPAEWVRRVAVGSTIRSWRRVLRRRPQLATGGIDPRSATLLGALARLAPGARRCLVLHHMAGTPLTEIAALEGVSVAAVLARLRRAEAVVSGDLTSLLPGLAESVAGAVSAPRDDGTEIFGGEEAGPVRPPDVDEQRGAS